MRVAQQCPRDRHALLLAPGERHRFTVEKRRLESDFIECRSQSLFREIASYAGRADAEIIADRSFEHHGCLHDKRDATPELTGIKRSGVAPIESHRSRRRLDEAVETAKHSRLPGTRRADKRERAPTLYAERDIIQDVNCGMPATPRIGEGKMVYLENQIVHLMLSFVVQKSHP